MKHLPIAWIVLLFAILMLAMCAAAKASDDHYCDYTTEKAESDRILQQSPTLAAGLGRDSTANEKVIVVAVKESLSGFLKGKLTGQIGRNDCLLYQMTNSLQKHVTYDNAWLTSLILNQRVAAETNALVDLQNLYDQQHAKLAAGTVTKIQLATIQAAMEKVKLDRNHTNEQIAAITLPEADRTPIYTLVADLEDLTKSQQRLISSQAKKDNWDVNLVIGQGSNPAYPILSGHTLPFGSINFTYSFGAPARNRHLDHAGEAYAAWQHDEDNGTIHLAELLRQSVEKTRAAAMQTYATNREYEDLLDTQLRGLNNDTAAAEAFRVQLTIESITQHIETQVSLATSSHMGAYLQENFR